MLILTIRTDKPESEIGLYDTGQQLVYEKWEAHRKLAESIHAKIKEILDTRGCILGAVNGIVVYEGPGSFTGLRIGVSVANALGYGIGAAVVGATGDDWIDDGIKRLNGGHNTTWVVPEYGAPVFTTQPRK